MNSQELRVLQEAYNQVYGLDEASPKRIKKPSKNPRLMNDAGPARVYNPSPKKVEEEMDLYDIILSHLLDEGYAETPEAAEAIMVNMSEDWRGSIVDEGYKEIDREKHGRMYNRYKKLRTAAMKDAQETGEASGDNRYKMGKMSKVIDKSAENLRNKG
jgi:hypothetical protein